MTTISLAHAVPRSEALRNSLVLLVFGIFLVGMTGFSHLENLHNAAHDTRHALSFPCH